MTTTKIIIGTIIATTTLFAGVWAYTFPVPEITRYECSKQHRDEVGDDCKQSTTVLTPDMYHTHLHDTPLRQQYSVLRGGTYTSGKGWDIDDGGHTGVDIVSAEGTPLYSIDDGVVVEAHRNKPGYGNVVKIQHHRDDGSVFYAIYAHLEKIDVEQGHTIKEGALLGTIGNTGMSTTPHLHREIQTTTKYGKPRYPYVYCPEQDWNQQMNHGGCRDYLRDHSIDPLSLFADRGEMGNSVDVAHHHDHDDHSHGDHTPSGDTPQAVPQSENQPLPPKSSWHREQADDNTHRYTNTEKNKHIGTYDAIQEVLDSKLPAFDTNRLDSDSQKFLALYRLDIDGPDQLIFDQDQDTISLRLSRVHKKTGALYGGELPFAMNLITLRDRVWVKEEQGSDGSTLLFLSQRRDGLNIFLWTIDSQIVYAKPLLQL